MQKISCLFSLLIAKTIPHDMAAGRAGGTVMVSKSKVLKTRIYTGTPSLIWIGKVIHWAKIASKAMIAINFMPSA